MGLPLALTLGEPAGIGPDITLALWREREQRRLPPFYVLGDPGFLRARARLIGIDIEIAEAAPADAAACFPRALPVVPLGFAVTAAPGVPDDTSAPAAIGAIERAVADVTQGRAAAVVTNPIAKSVLYRAGFTYPGHTEFLAHLVRDENGVAPHPVMMLWAPELAVVPVTIHIPFAEVRAQLTRELIVRTARIVDRDMRRRFGLAAPRLVASGLNPHAGEDGTLGREEREIIEPALAELRADGIDIRGPLPADTMFHAAARATYDVALCMYHDQALIPIKTLAFDHGVNTTLGLPFVRTSPDHGTAFALAGTGHAHPESLAASLHLASRLARTRIPEPAT